MLTAPFAVLFEFDFLGNELLIFTRPIVRARALLTSYLYELILRHEATLYDKYTFFATLPFAWPCVKKVFYMQGNRWFLPHPRNEKNVREKSRKLV